MSNNPQEGRLDQSMDKADELTQLEFSASQRQLSSEEQQRLDRLRQQSGEIAQAATEEAKDTYQYETRFDRTQTDEQN